MEQRTLTAIILSILVLFLYQSVFSPKPTSPVINSETTTNKEVESKSNISLKKSPLASQPSTRDVFKLKSWPVQTPGLSGFVSNMGGALHNLKIKDRPAFPLSNIVTVKGYENSEFKQIQTSHDVSLEHVDDKIRIEKNVQVIDNNTLKVTVSIHRNSLLSSLDKPVEFNLFTIDSSSLNTADKRETMLDEYSYMTKNRIFRKNNAVKFDAKESKVIEGSIEWAGFREHYSTTVVRPNFATKSFELQRISEKSLNFSVVPAEVEEEGYEFIVYSGPQNVEAIKRAGPQMHKIVAFNSWNFVNWIAMAIYYTVPTLHSVFRSWGVSIILIGILIYGLSYPLTVKSMMSMRKMQLLQPKIKALQERYKGDPQKLNAEVMGIYRREKVNPLGGCLPFLLQMPLFVALYQVLWRAYYFQGESFLWISDLTKPDRLFTLPFSLPFLGNEFNILPILMAFVMFFQQKMSAKNIIVTDEQQAIQQKMMLYFFPIFLGFIFYHFASGLSLYFTVFYLLSTLTQWKMSNKISVK